MIQPQHLCRGRESSFMNVREISRRTGMGAWRVHQGLVPVHLSPPFGEAMKIWLKRFLFCSGCSCRQCRCIIELPPSLPASLLTPSWVGLKVARRQTERLQSFAPLRPPAVKSVRSRKEARRKGRGKTSGVYKTHLGPLRPDSQRVSDLRRRSFTSPRCCPGS